MTQISKVVSLLLKLGQLITLIVSTSKIAYFMDGMNEELGHLRPYHGLRDLGAFGRLEFLLFATVVGLAIVATALGFLIFKPQDILKTATTFAVVYALWTLVLLDSSSLLTKTVKQLHHQYSLGSSVCSDLKSHYIRVTCDHLDVAVVSAFFAVLFFIADTLLYIFYWRMHKYTATLVNAENVPFSA